MHFEDDSLPYKTMMCKQFYFLILVITVAFNQILFCDSARKIRYHRARNINRKADPQFPISFGGLSDGEGGDIFGFLTYYDSEEDDFLRNGTLDEYSYDYEFSRDDINLEYDDPIPSTTPRYAPTPAPPRPKSANVSSLSYRQKIDKLVLLKIHILHLVLTLLNLMI